MTEIKVGQVWEHKIKDKKGKVVFVSEQSVVARFGEDSYIEVVQEYIFDKQNFLVYYKLDHPKLTLKYWTILIKRDEHSTAYINSFETKQMAEDSAERMVKLGYIVTEPVEITYEGRIIYAT